MGVQSITTLPALAVTVGSAQLRGEIVLGPSWPDAQGYIYNEGEHEEMWVVGEASSGSVLTKELDHLKASCPEDRRGTWVTDVKVNVSNFSVLKVTWLYTNEWTSGGVTLGLATSKIGYAYIASLAEYAWFDSTPRTSSLDISGVTGEYYVHFMTSGSMDQSIGRLYKIWLE
jgi:hypothetical protein